MKEKLDVIVKAFSEAEKNNIRLNIVGVTEEQFRGLCCWDDVIPASVSFWGRIDHLQVIKLVKASDWAIILRENNRVVKAGFPTKLVESISCGTPVIVNRFSNIEDYLDDTNSILIESMDELNIAIERACKSKVCPDRTLFDYREYTVAFEEFLK